MKNCLIAILCLLYLPITAQEKKALEWINNNSIEIEDADPNSRLENFSNQVPEKFKNARVFGFGEASHHGKEFFDIKAKFFKYLVKSQNVKAFIMEESYPAESGINEWISGGEGNIETIAQNFSIYPWHTKEVVSLLEWMRSYNSEKPKKEHIRFYGIDIQNVEGINQELRQIKERYDLPISDDLLAIVDVCTNKKNDYQKSPNWAETHTPKLREVQEILLDQQSNSDPVKFDEINSAIRALNYLVDYTDYVQDPESQVRDLKMFENAKWIIDHETANGKAFIWAHNEHINNKELLSYGSGWTNLGGHLKQHYEDAYYSVGFDFGIGELRGYVVEKNKPNHWETFELEKPFRKTYSKVLYKANKEIYFIDMATALEGEASSFFKDKKKHLVLGAPGYNPTAYHLINKKFAEMFDGLIFVKKISVPNYNLNGS